MQVRISTRDDVPSICEFVTKLAEYEKLLDQVKFTEASYRRYLFEDPPIYRPEVLIAQLGDDCSAGFALFIQISEKTIHLEDLFVDPKMRGKGLGISLLSHLAKEAVSREVSELQWNCLSWNKPSIEFYESLGARQIPNRIAYRITGDRLARNVGDIDANNLSIADAIHGKCTPIRVTHKSTGASVSYSLSFTTFNGTPVIYVTDVIPNNSEIPDDLVHYLIREAQKNGYTRVDICLDSETQKSAADALITKYGAIEMTGWIAFRLAGDSLRELASRTQSA